MNVKTEREENGTWIAGNPSIPGVMACGASRPQAIAKAEFHAIRIIADRIEHGELYRTAP